MENKQKQNSQKLPKEKRGKKIKQSSLKEIQQSYLRVRECMWIIVNVLITLGFTLAKCNQIPIVVKLKSSPKGVVQR